MPLGVAFQRLHNGSEELHKPIHSPGNHESLWIQTTPATEYDALEDSIEVDVAILGGGIAGIVTAAQLKVVTVTSEGTIELTESR